MKGGKNNMSESNKSVFWSRMAAGVLGLVLVGGAVSYAIPNEVEVKVPVNVSVPGKTVFTDVLVDNGNLALVLDHLYDNDGDVNYLLNDLDNDEIELVVDRIIFVNEAKTMAVNYVESNMADELDKVAVEGEYLDEDDIERIRIDDDDDEVLIEDIDFDDSDAHVIVSATFEQDDVDYKATFDVKIKDGEVDDMELVFVELD